MRIDRQLAHGSARGRAGTLCAVIVVILAAAPFARADSIWDRRTRSAAFLYMDNGASEVGDSLTVLIADQSSFSIEAEREAEKTTEHSGEIAIETSLVDVTWPPEKAKQNSSRKFKGSSDYTATRKLLDSITVTVVDKLPNGNLVVAGRSWRAVSGEQVETVLSGVVKAEDISGDNTVSSQRVAHLKIHYETSGSSESYLKEGILNAVLNLLWPF